MRVFSPARYFVVGILNCPENFSVFSTTVVTVLFCFRNLFALNFFTIQKVLFGNFRIAIFPTISWGIFFMVNKVCKDIKMLLGCDNYGIKGK